MDTLTFIQQCRDSNFNIIEAIKAVHKQLDIPLGQAKDLVSAHPAYELIHAKAQPLHDAAEKVAMFETVKLSRQQVFELLAYVGIFADQAHGVGFLCQDQSEENELWVGEDGIEVSFVPEGKS